jgi:membrane dipeptidase
MELADTLIGLVEEVVQRAPDKYALARSTRDVFENVRAKKISLCLSLENGSPIAGKIENVKKLFDRGIRYITLAHSKDNHLGDSSYDTTRTWKGLSPFGIEVVREMNRLGIMVDLTHMSDDAAYKIIEVSQAPVIASHSACRAFTPNFERNISDDLIRLVAKTGGVVMINFGTWFVNSEFHLRSDTLEAKFAEFLKETGYKESDSAAIAFMREYRKNHPLPKATVSDVANHIDYVVKLAGVDYVGFGSDFEGVNSLPVGLTDVSMYPNLIAELIRRGYSDRDIKKICGKNLLCVWEKVEEKAKELQKANTK